MILEIWMGWAVSALILFLLLQKRTIKLWQKSTLLLCCLGLMAIPVDGLPLAAYWRGFFGDLSTITQTWLLFAAIGAFRSKPLMAPAERVTLAVWLVILGALLYPASLGLSIIDPYQWGYQPVWLTLAVVVIGIQLWWRKYWWATLLLACTLIDFQHRMTESNNLWDYLIDPALWIYCFWILLRSRRPEGSAPIVQHGG